MSDIYSKSKRSDIMSKIPSKETQPEILVRKYLFSKGFRFRKNVKELPGKPDIVLPKYKIAIFMAVFGMDILVEEVTCQVQIDNSGKAKFLKI
mgnify:CR=1 FL=1